jgi:hypothetical protein
VANDLYNLIVWLGGSNARRMWKAHTNHLSQQALEIARRDPGRRVLVVVNVRHCHHIRNALSKYPEVYIVRYSQL